MQKKLTHSYNFMVLLEVRFLQREKRVGATFVWLKIQYFKLNLNFLPPVHQCKVLGSYPTRSWELMNCCFAWSSVENSGSDHFLILISNRTSYHRFTNATREVTYVIKRKIRCYTEPNIIEILKSNATWLTHDPDIVCIRCQQPSSPRSQSHTAAGLNHNWLNHLWFSSEKTARRNETTELHESPSAASACQVKGKNVHLWIESAERKGIALQQVHLQALWRRLLTER